MATAQAPAVPLFSGLRAPTSFSSHRRNRTAFEDGDVDSEDEGQEDEARMAEHPSVYRIPQRTGRMPTAPPPTPVTSRGPPRPLALASANASIAPAPLTAPVRSRMGGARIDVALAKNMARGPNTGGGRGWPSSPGKTPTSAGFPRARGLTVAILMGDGELYAESAPVTPSATGLKTEAQMQAQPPSQDMPAPPRAIELVSSPGVPDHAVPATPRVHEKILCRYYHTGGLSCTSSPCRFIHKIEHPQTPVPGTAPYSAMPLLSPRNVDSPDPTSGTFAAAQASALGQPQPQPHPHPQLLEIGGDVSGITAGEAVAVVNEAGAEHVGFVYKMSGGGKGPAGKSRLKYRTVPCKDYATGTCAYGDDYCSFIHDDNNLYDEEKHGKKDKDKPTYNNANKGKGNAAAANMPRTPRTPRTPSYANIAGKVSPLVFKPPASTSMQPIKTSAPKSSYPKPSNNVKAVESSPPADAILTPTLDDSHVVFPPYANLPAPRLGNPPHRQRNVKVLKKEHVHFDSPPLARVAPALTRFSVETPMTEVSDPPAAWDPAVHHAQAQDIPPTLEAYADGDAFPHNMGYPWSPEWHGGVWLQTPLYPTSNVNPNAPGSPMEMSPLTDCSPHYPYPMSPYMEQGGMPNSAFSASYPWNGDGMRDPHSMPSPIDIRAPFTPLGPNGVPFPPLDKSGVPFSPNMMWSPTWSDNANYGLGIGLRSPELIPGRQYWRTRPCTFWVKSGGRECPQGESCSFQHVLPSPSTPFARARLRRGGHPSSPYVKTMACKFFNSKEGCTRSEAECNFAHVKIVPEGHYLELRPSRTRPCRHFQQGRCTRGAECHFAHVSDPTAVKGTTAPPVTPVTPFMLLHTPPTVAKERANSAPASSGDHEASLLAAAFDSALACPEWTGTGRCAREWCTAPHEDADVEGAATLTEVSLAAACAVLRAKASEQSSAVESDSDSDEDDVDDVEIVTNTHSRPSTRSSRSV